MFRGLCFTPKLPLNWILTSGHLVLFLRQFARKTVDESVSLGAILATARREIRG